MLRLKGILETKLSKTPIQDEGADPAKMVLERHTSGRAGRNSKVSWALFYGIFLNTGNCFSALSTKLINNAEPKEEAQQVLKLNGAFKMLPDNCLLCVSGPDCIVTELWQVGPGFVGSFLKFSPRRRLGVEGNRQMAQTQAWVFFNNHKDKNS